MSHWIWMFKLPSHLWGLRIQKYMKPSHQVKVRVQAKKIFRWWYSKFHKAKNAKHFDQKAAVSNNTDAVVSCLTQCSRPGLTNFSCPWKYSLEFPFLPYCPAMVHEHQPEKKVGFLMFCHSRKACINPVLFCQAGEMIPMGRDVLSMAFLLMVWSKFYQIGGKIHSWF